MNNDKLKKWEKYLAPEELQDTQPTFSNNQNPYRKKTDAEIDAELDAKTAQDILEIQHKREEQNRNFRPDSTEERLTTYGTQSAAGYSDYVDMVHPERGYTKVRNYDLGKALNAGYKLLNAGDNVKVRDIHKQQDVSVPTDQLQDYFNSKGYNEYSQLAKPGYTDYAQEMVRGAATKVGKIADTAVGIGSTMGGMAAHLAGDVAGYAGFDETSNTLHDFGKKAISTAEDFHDNDKIASYPDKMLDTDFSHLKSARIANTAGSMVPDLWLFKPIGRAVSPMTKNLQPITMNWRGKEMTINVGEKINNLFNIERSFTNAAGFAAAGAGGEMLKKDDPNTPVYENIARELVGSLGLSTVPYAGKAGFNAMWQSVKKIPFQIKELPTDLSSKIISLFTKKGEVDVETYANLTKLGIEPSPEMIVKDSKVLNWLAKTRNKFSDDIIKTTNDKTLESIETSLDKHLGEHIGKVEGAEAASSRVSSHTQKELESYIGEIKEINKVNYEEAVKLLSTTEYPPAIETLKQAKKQLVSIKGLSKGSTTETGRDIVVSRLENIIKEISRSENFTINPQTLINEMSSLKEFMRTNNVKSFSKTLSPIISAIEKDLLSVKGNEPYLNAIKYANNFYKDNLVPFIKADISKAVIDGEAPIAAYGMMNNTANMLELKTILQHTPNGLNTYDMLRRVKAKEVLTENVFNNGEFSPQKFYDLFMKSKNDEYLYELLGESYNEIKKNILPVAKMLERNKSLMSNPSGTVHSARMGVGGYQIGKGVLTLDAKSVAEGLLILKGPELLAATLLNPKTSSKLVKSALKNNDVQFKKLLLQSVKNSTKFIKDTPLKQVALDSTIINQQNTYNKDRVRRNGGKQFNIDNIDRLDW